jgi:hypothetical protein
MNRYFLVVSLILNLSLFACGKDGDIGPAGAQGDTGPAGEDGSDCTMEMDDCAAAMTCDDGTYIRWEIGQCDDGILFSSGRMWMRCAQGMTFENGTCTGTAMKFQYCDAQDNSCNGGVDDGILDGNGNSQVWDTCNDLVYAGYTDWRVPNLEELASLVLCDDGPLNYPSRTTCGHGNSTSLTIDTTLFPNFPYNSLGTPFWTSAACFSDVAWDIDFGGYGYVGKPIKDASEFVFCVR